MVIDLSSDLINSSQHGFLYTRIKHCVFKPHRPDKTLCPSKVFFSDWFKQSYGFNEKGVRDWGIKKNRCLDCVYIELCKNFPYMKKTNLAYDEWKDTIIYIDHNDAINIYQVWRVPTSHAKTMGVVKTRGKNTSVSVTLVRSLLPCNIFIARHFLT